MRRIAYPSIAVTRGRQTVRLEVFEKGPWRLSMVMEVTADDASTIAAALWQCAELWRREDDRLRQQAFRAKA